MESVFSGVLDSIHLAELGWWWWMVALLLAWRLMGSLLKPRVGAGGGGPVRYSAVARARELDLV